MEGEKLTDKQRRELLRRYAMLSNKKKARGNIRKGKPYGRILYSNIVGGREISYHATKGYRNRRV